MRIISGTAKGRKLATPPLHTDRIRPTSDRAREAVFNIIGERIIQADVLDLFAGTGALGLEAFSRNASSVVFVDNDKLALKLLKKNILHCHSTDLANCEVRVIKHDLSHKLPIKTFSNHTVSQFDIIFADPPYSTNLSSKMLAFINKSNILKEDGLLIIEERHTVNLPSSLTTITLHEKRSYGESAFWFYAHI